MVPTPSTRPIYPDTVVINTDSVRIRLMMDQGVAPRALRMPISLVRSFTAISMILLMPTMPAKIVPMPITQMKIRMFLNRSMNF